MVQAGKMATSMTIVGDMSVHITNMTITTINYIPRLLILRK